MQQQTPTSAAPLSAGPSRVHAHRTGRILTAQGAAEMCLCCLLLVQGICLTDSVWWLMQKLWQANARFDAADVAAVDYYSNQKLEEYLPEAASHWRPPAS